MLVCCSLRVKPLSNHRFKTVKKLRFLYCAPNSGKLGLWMKDVVEGLCRRIEILKSEEYNWSNIPRRIHVEWSIRLWITSRMYFRAPRNILNQRLGYRFQKNDRWTALKSLSGLAWLLFYNTAPLLNVPCWMDLRSGLINRVNPCLQKKTIVQCIGLGSFSTRRVYFRKREIDKHLSLIPQFIHVHRECCTVFSQKWSGHINFE